MASNQWPYPGSRWWKFDFHTHTPASKDTNGWQQAIGTPNELTPENWLLKYMAAEIDCVAVTDHNSGAWVDTLKTAYAQMKAQPPTGFRELTLFPGVEISAQGAYKFQRSSMKLDQIEAELVRDFRLNPNLVVYIRADENGAYKHVASVVDRCQRNGITRLSFRTAPEKR